MAIKRAVRAPSGRSRDSRSSLPILGNGFGEAFDKNERRPSSFNELEESGHISAVMSLESDGDSESSNDLENQVDAATTSGVIRNGKRGSAGYMKGKSKQSGALDLGFLVDLYGKGKRGRKGYANETFHEALSIVSSGSMHSRTLTSRLCPWFDGQVSFLLDWRVPEVLDILPSYVGWRNVTFFSLHRRSERRTL